MTDDCDVTDAKDFLLQSEFTVSDKQQAAVDRLKQGLEKHCKHQTLLGVTGSGKTFTMANLIQQTGRPALLMAPNKTLAGNYMRR